MKSIKTLHLTAIKNKNAQIKRKIFSALAVVLFMTSLLNANTNAVVVFNYKNCTEYAEIIEYIMSGEECGDVEAFNMAYSYCQKNMFQGVDQIYED